MIGPGVASWLPILLACLGESPAPDRSDAHAPAPAPTSAPAPSGGTADGTDPCDVDGDGFRAERCGGDDCQDEASDVHPGAGERCDARDNDCDGLLGDADPDWDPADAWPQWLDLDGDGYGSQFNPVSCDPLPYNADNGDDCNDGASWINPGESERCNLYDDDCDALVDDLDPSVAADSLVDLYADQDGDGLGDGSAASQACYPACGLVPDAEDCDDTNAAVGRVSDWYVDADGDGHGAGLPIEVGTCAPLDPTLVPGGFELDCADGDASVFPGADDPCGDGLDADCNGFDACHPALTGALDTDSLEVAITGTAEPGTFGADLSVADVTGDGRADLTVLGGYTTGYYGTGQVYVFPGPLAPGATVDMAAPIQIIGFYDTWSLVAGGDFTCDGLPDLVIGHAGGWDWGRVDVIAGPLTRGGYVLGADAYFLGGYYEGLGVFLAGPTDLDGDAADEIWVASAGGDVVRWMEGPWFGYSGLSGDAVQSSAGDVISNDEPPAVDDFDGDGVREVAFGASAANGGDGAVWVFSHAPVGVEGTSSADVALTAESAGDALGWRVAEAGDATGDGTADLLVSAIDRGAGAGAVYLVAGPIPAGSVAAAVLRVDGEGAEGFGESLAGAGDLDGDGVREALVRSRAAEPVLVDLGAVGTWPRSGLSRLEIVELPSGNLGSRAAGDADLDGDGLDDLALGSPGQQLGFYPTGAAYVLFGAP